MWRSSSRWVVASFGLLGACDGDVEEAAQITQAATVTDAGPTGPRPGDDMRAAAEARLAEREQRAFVTNTRRADLIAVATVGIAIGDGQGQYPNGELDDDMQLVPLTLGTFLKGGSSAPVLSGYLNFSRRRLTPGDNVLVFLRQTPSGGWFILTTIPLVNGAVPPGLASRVQEALQ